MNMWRWKMLCKCHYFIVVQSHRQKRAFAASLWGHANGLYWFSEIKLWFYTTWVLLGYTNYFTRKLLPLSTVSCFLWLCNKEEQRTDVKMKSTKMKQRLGPAGRSTQPQPKRKEFDKCGHWTDGEGLSNDFVVCALWLKGRIHLLPESFLYYIQIWWIPREKQPCWASL